MDGNDDAPGWAAIDAALRKVYGEQEPQHWGTVIPMMLGGQDPLDGISVYDAEDHWHYVTYGFSELFDKETDDKAWSGYGFELTFRLRKTDPEPPKWCASLLQNLARYVFRTHNGFAPGHKMGLNSPIALDHDTAIPWTPAASRPPRPILGLGISELFLRFRAISAAVAANWPCTVGKFDPW